MRARVAITVLGFFAVLAAAGTPPRAAAVAVSAAERAQTLGGELERTPVVAAHPTAVQSGIARAANGRPGPWKLPPLPLALDVSAAPLAWSSPRAIETARAPIAPPSAPRSCRGPPAA